MIDINKLYDIYIKENTDINLIKVNVLEQFRTVEANFKYYEDALNLLEKEKTKAKVDSYKKLSEEILDELRKFNPYSIEENLPAVNNKINYLIEVGDDVSSTSQKFKHIEATWNSFLERNPHLDHSSVFMHTIMENIHNTKLEFEDIDLVNLSRIEENIIDLSHSVERSISMIESLQKLLDNNDFVGKEPQVLEKKIKSFIQEDYKTMTLLDITRFHKEVEAKIAFYKQKLLLKRVKAKVIKIMNKNDLSIYNYGIELNGVLLYPSEKLSGNEVLENTGEFLYIDNFPIYGIVPLETIQKDIEVSDAQFDANKELSSTSLKLFFMGIIISVFLLMSTIISDVTPLITIPLVALVAGVFVFLFKGLRYNINSKYDLPNMFYFFKVSYVFVKIGDDGLNVQNVVPKILENFTKIISHDASLKKELNKQRLIRQNEELKKAKEKENKKESIFNKLKKKLQGGKNE